MDTMDQELEKTFDIRARFKKQTRPQAIITKAKTPGQFLTPKESTHLLDYVVFGTRSVLKKVLHEETAGMQGTPDIATDPLHGRCSFSQCIGAYTLLDMGLCPKPFSVQSLRSHHVGHAVLTVEIPQENGAALFLIDPTYRQFCDPRMPVYNGKPMPGYFLAGEEGGGQITEKLLHDGYIQITPDIAQKYLASFCEGKSPFATTSQAMEFLRNPPYDNCYQSFDRNIMQQKGYLFMPEVPEPKQASRTKLLVPQKLSLTPP